jgi:hypothetical protein
MKMSNSFVSIKCKQGRLLCMSSCFFLIPSIYAYKNGLYFYSILLLLTTIVSTNFWRNAIDSWRRDLDLFFAKVSFIVFCSNGVYYIRYLPYIVTGYSGLFVLLYCYYLSDKYLKDQNTAWCKYHFIFHLLLTYEQFIIIDSILKYE